MVESTAHKCRVSKRVIKNIRAGETETDPKGSLGLQITLDQKILKIDRRCPEEEHIQNR